MRTGLRTPLLWAMPVEYLTPAVEEAGLVVPHDDKYRLIGGSWWRPTPGLS